MGIILTLILIGNMYTYITHGNPDAVSALDVTKALACWIGAIALMTGGLIYALRDRKKDKPKDIQNK
jgi:hypothetical protein